MTELIESLHITSSPYINAIIVIAAFTLIALFINIVVMRLLIKVAKLTKSEFDNRILKILRSPIFFTIIFSSVVYAFDGLYPNKKTGELTENIIYSLIALFWTVAGVRISNVIVENAIFRLFDITGLRKDILPLIKNVTRVAVVVGALMAVLSIWKVDITPVLASAGIISAAIAFAGKDTIANFFGGVSIFFDKPYKVGDFIELDEGRRGEVVDIGMRSTRIKTRDDLLVSIPNSIIANNQIINESAPVRRFRLRVPVSVAYGTDVDLLEQTLLNIAQANANVVDDPAPRLRFRKFGESGLEFELLCWADNPADKGLTIHQLGCMIIKNFTEVGINIPFPQRVIRLIDNKFSITKREPGSEI